jgi:hypothetical protein
MSMRRWSIMNDIRERLLERDYLYDDATAYRAGVEAAIAAMEADHQSLSSDADPHPVASIR